nr:sialate O-acetylesterase [Allomuricauda sp.]
MKFLLAFVYCLFGINLIAAQLSLPHFFSDHMVLQRDKPIHFWGKGKPDRLVSVKFFGEVKQVRVAKDSTWSVHFKARDAISIPGTVHFYQGQEKIVLSNMLIGDVWLCIGQSNMEWPMEKETHFEEELKNIGQTSLRFYNPTYAGKNVYGRVFSDSIGKRLQIDRFFEGNWQLSNSSTVKTMSAVGYYFGKKIGKEEKIPIGLINLAIGGAPLETFISLTTLKNDVRFSGKARKDWIHNNNLPIWVRERATQNTKTAANIPSDSLGPNHAFKPGFAYSAGIEPMLRMPIKGIIWYQGESNAQEIERVQEYADLQELMILDYREKWRIPDLPFYWVQLSSIDSIQYRSQYWPHFRDAQRNLLVRIKHGGMAVSSDIGARNDVHPTNKKDVGERLARWALKDVYGHDVIPSGPLPKKAIYKNGQVIVSFKYGHGLSVSGRETIKGFSVDGKSPIEAFVVDDNIVIPVSERPDFLYYGWQPWTEANLINSEKLPASTFKVKVKITGQD